MVFILRKEAGNCLLCTCFWTIVHKRTMHIYNWFVDVVVSEEGRNQPRWARWILWTMVLQKSWHLGQVHNIREALHHHKFSLCLWQRERYFKLDSYISLRLSVCFSVYIFVCLCPCMCVCVWLILYLLLYILLYNWHKDSKMSSFFLKFNMKNSVERVWWAV